MEWSGLLHFIVGAQAGEARSQVQHTHHNPEITSPVPHVIFVDQPVAGRDDVEPVFSSGAGYMMMMVYVL